MVFGSQHFDVSIADERTTEISADDARAMVRLLAELAMAPPDAATRKSLLLNGLIELIDADKWVWAQMVDPPDGSRASFVTSKPGANDWSLDAVVVFGEDVAGKGGVYTVTKGLWKRFGGARVFNTLLDETTILGLAQGYGSMGYLPIPEIQYLAYFHNACDQIRGEACSLQYFSNNAYRNPMVVRIAGLGYQKGFGGHFHNDNSVTALRDIPGLVVGCPSRGDDAVRMLRTLAALAKIDGRVTAIVEPIALYMTKDLYDRDDGAWSFAYPEPDEYLEPWEPRIYGEEATDVLIVTFGNGVPMALRAARELERTHGVAARVLDLRWLAPLPTRDLLREAADSEGRAERPAAVMDPDELPEETRRWAERPGATGRGLGRLSEAITRALHASATVCPT